MGLPIFLMKSRPLVVLAILLALLIGVALFLRPKASIVVPSTSDPSTATSLQGPSRDKKSVGVNNPRRVSDEISTASPNASDTPPTTAPSPESLTPAGERQFVAILETGGNVEVPDADSVFLEIGNVTEENRAQWSAPAPGQPGPKRAEELADFATKISLPLEVLADGTTRVGPVSIPGADAYRLGAWNNDGEYFQATFHPHRKGDSVDGGRIPASKYAGVEFRFVGVPESEKGVELHISRKVDPATTEWTSQLLFLTEQMAPLLHAAMVFEEPLLLDVKDGVRLFPLPADPAAMVRFTTVLGEVSQEGDMEVALTPGEFTPVLVDWKKLFGDGSGRLLTMTGHVRLSPGNRPLAGASMRRLGAPLEELQTLGPDGEFTFVAIPRMTPLRFEIVPASRDAKGRPFLAGPVEVPVAAAEVDAMTNAVEKDITLDAYRWMRLDFNESLKASTATPPYPIYALQATAEGGDWRIIQADEFLSDADGVWVSVARPGTYRILTALTPYTCLPSSSTVVGGETLEEQVSVTTPDHEITVQLTVVSQRNGKPLADADILVRGPESDFPATRHRLDGRGKLELARVTVDEISVRAAGASPATWASVAVSAGEVIVELP